MTLPVALAVFWIFQKFLKAPLIMLLPERAQRRLSVDRAPLRVGGLRRLPLIVASLVTGITTHLVWDDFTHYDTWFYRHVALLRRSFLVPALGRMAGYTLMQDVSSVIGLVILAVWLVHWYRTSAPSAEPLSKAFSGVQKLAIVSGILAVAVVAGLLRAVIRAGLSTNPHLLSHFLVQAVATTMALAWWQLVAYAFFLRSALSWEKFSADREGGP
jgi:hypothetical protein